MRSDLFRRSLNNALITDFFGGVSQAEVTPPDASDDYHPILETPPAGETFDVAGPLPAPRTPAPFTPSREDVYISDLRTLGLWGGLALLGVTTTWVFRP